MARPISDLVLEDLLQGSIADPYLYSIARN
jgi:hypothetical protein